MLVFFLCSLLHVLFAFFFLHFISTPLSVLSLPIPVAPQTGDKPSRRTVNQDLRRFDRSPACGGVLLTGTGLFPANRGWHSATNGSRRIEALHTTSAMQLCPRPRTCGERNQAGIWTISSLAHLRLKWPSSPRQQAGNHAGFRHVSGQSECNCGDGGQHGCQSFYKSPAIRLTYFTQL